MKFDIFHELMVPENWDEQIERKIIFDTLEQIEFADTLGYTTVWVARHHATGGFSHTPAPEVLFGALAKTTSKIRLGFGVELLPIAHPVYVAERAALVDVLTDGRVDVGTGRTMGEGQLNIFGVKKEETRERWTEHIRILPELWAGTKVTHHGKYWSWDKELTIVPRVVQKPHPPLWVAASRNETAKLAGEKGIGMLMSTFRSPEDLRDDVAAYKEAVKNPIDQIGRFKNDEAVVVAAAACVDKNDSGAYERARKGMSRYLAAVRKGYGENQGAHATINTISDDDIFTKGIMLIGDPDYIVEGIRKFEAIGADRVMLLGQFGGVPHEDVMRSLELIGKYVIPQFNKVPAVA
jgi:alkanesulfonate monooxygenase SsuD/methylene tetrahydromethanopterin reductase-like flavin-dependent oxidoreductase (luciferase family)